jgi:hypothetical protein
MEIGKMKLLQALPHLADVANLYKLRLYVASEFKLARIILVNLYCKELNCEYYDEEY